MKIVAIDVRALAIETVTGVGIYQQRLIAAMMVANLDLGFKLWTVGSQTPHTSHIAALIQREQDSHIHTPMSNRFFNVACGLGWSGNKLYDQVSAQCYFFPHLNYIPLPIPAPFIVTVHDLSFLHQPAWYDLKGRLWHYALRLREVLTSARYIIAVSESTSQQIQHFFPHIPSSKIKVIHNGLSHKVLESEELLRISSQLQLPQKFILYVGTLEPRKNLASVIAAFLEVQKKHPDLKLVLAGKYGWSTSQKKLTTKYQKILIWLDYVSEDQKAALYQLATAFVWPSFYEGFGFPPLEATMYGTPVITSYTTAMPELLEQHAWYVNPYNYHELAQVIDEIISTRTAKVANTALAERYSWKETAEKTLDLLQTL